MKAQRSLFTSPNESQKLANAPSAEVVNGSEEQQPQHDVCTPERALHMDPTNENRQNHQDPKLIGEALAEELNDSSSIYERDSRNATQASCGNIAANCATEETNIHPAGCTAVVITRCLRHALQASFHTPKIFNPRPQRFRMFRLVILQGAPQTEAPVDQLTFAVLRLLKTLLRRLFSEAEKL